MNALKRMCRLLLALLCGLMTLLPLLGLAGKAQAQAWTPNSVSGLSAWYEPSQTNGAYKDTGKATLCSADGDVIALLKDLSGNGYDAVQATTGQRPTYSTSSGQFAGQVAVHLNGSQSVVVPSGAIGNPDLTGWTEMIVCKYDNISNNVAVLTSQAYQQSDFSLTLQPGILKCGGISDGGSGSSFLQAQSQFSAPMCLIRRFTPLTSSDQSCGRMTWWLNGRMVYDAWATACDIASNQGQMFLGDLSIALGSNYGINGYIASYALYHKPLSDNSVADLTSYASSRFGMVCAAAQPDLRPVRAVNIIGSGNSIMAAYTTNGQSALKLLQDRLPFRANVYNFGRGFATTTYVTTWAAQKELTAIQPGATNIVIYLEGTNDLQAGGATAASVYAAHVAYAATVRAAGGKFVECTVLPIAGNATFNGLATSLNALIRGDSTHFDGVADIAAQTVSTSDGTHPDNGGQATVEGVEIPVVLSLASAATTGYVSSGDTASLSAAISAIPSASANASAVWGAGTRTLTGNVTVGGYASGQDPAALLAGSFAAIPSAVSNYNVGGTGGALSLKAAHAISASVQGGSYLAGLINTTTHLQTVTYYLPGTTLAAMNAGTATVIDTALVGYASDNRTIVSRVDTPGTF